jgi:hypothetical protein
MSDLGEFWRLAKRRKWTAALLVVAPSVLSAVLGFAWKAFIQDRIMEALHPPMFRNLAGLYTGKMEGNSFHFCLVVYDPHVLGSLTWDNDPTHLYSVNYEGDILPDQVKFDYARNPDHPVPDKGIAYLVNENGEYKGYWKSTDGKNSEPHFDLTKVGGSTCELLNWKSPR